MLLLVLGIFLGLSIGIGLWMQQQLQIDRYLVQMQYLTRSTSMKLLLPRLRHNIATLQAERQDLEQQLQTYQMLLEFAPLGYLQVDDENQLLWCNKQARELLYLQKWQPGQVRLLLELVRSYELDRLLEKTRDRQLSQQREWVFHPSCENPEDMLKLASVALRATTLPLPSGKVAVFLENRQPLVDLSEARDRAFSDLAHELRTPLTSIRLVVETLQERVEPPLNRWVNRLLNEVDRLINLVQSWLELSGIENNSQLQLNCQPLSVRSLIAEVWETLEPIAERYQIKFSYDAEDDIWLCADKSQMHRVFLNILDNSIKHSPQGGNIYVETKIIYGKKDLGKPAEPQLVEINLTDSGTGFAPEDLPHVFDRFYRGDKARSRPPRQDGDSASGFVHRHPEGTGLGLAIVHQIISTHEGSIKAMNHPHTGGAWLQIVLPQQMPNTRNQDYI